MKKALCALICIAVHAVAQCNPPFGKYGPLPGGVLGCIPNAQVIIVATDPSGSCNNAKYLQYNSANGNLWGCQTNWTKISGSGGAKLRVPISFNTGGSSLAAGTEICGNIGQAGTPSQIVLYTDISATFTVTFTSVAQSSYSGPSSATTTLGTESFSSQLTKLDSSPGWGAISANTAVCATLTSVTTAPTWITVEVTF